MVSNNSNDLNTLLQSDFQLKTKCVINKRRVLLVNNKRLKTSFCLEVHNKLLIASDTILQPCNNIINTIMPQHRL